MCDGARDEVLRWSQSLTRLQALVNLKDSSLAVDFRCRVFPLSEAREINDGGSFWGIPLISGGGQRQMCASE
jgi:hypothetical protein